MAFHFLLILATSLKLTKAPNGGGGESMTGRGGSMTRSTASLGQNKTCNMQ